MTLYLKISRNKNKYSGSKILYWDINFLIVLEQSFKKDNGINVRLELNAVEWFQLGIIVESAKDVVISELNRIPIECLTWTKRNTITLAISIIARKGKAEKVTH